jgi:hypothetical protein
MKTKNCKGKEEMENVQSDYKAKKSITVCMKKILTFSHILQDTPPVPWQEVAKYFRTS